MNVRRTKQGRFVVECEPGEFAPMLPNMSALHAVLNDLRMCGMSDRAIALALGLSPAVVSHWRNRFHKRGPSAAVMAQLIALHESATQAVESCLKDEMLKALTADA